jgi:hypothetical protein
MVIHGQTRLFKFGNGLLLSFGCSEAVGNCQEDNMPVKLKMYT